MEGINILRNSRKNLVDQRHINNRRMLFSNNKLYTHLDQLIDLHLKQNAQVLRLVEEIAKLTRK